MGKKKQARSVNDGKVRLETRIDPKIADQFRAIAEEAGVSVNQILQGLIIWATDNAVQGTPVETDAGELYAEPRPGCLFVGQESFFTDEEFDENGQLIAPTKLVPGVVHLVLDFSVQNAIRTRANRGQ
ncbi:hypothetical protein [Rhodopirellula sp. MGV]|uniref:hypothetical protein n=1 Tax=Rhodopirellula sp. MGV TaxID=2023130 RepID=UPI000B960327|nr:hypothetical protein [Rhodopirellula sp. MGV]OYP34507.1 hypothetical protein CGZ80_14640 [Rhodopirellula sp. MGV]PNY36901.1 hypothetical protein C2E31_10605 [Rhodopirellula baltica]